MKGLIDLLASKKGTVFGAVAAVLGGMMAEGSLPQPLGAKLLVVLAAAHLVSQGIADWRKPPDAPTEPPAPAA